MKNGEPVKKIIETTVGRVIFNEVVPKEVGFINEILTKKSLREIISNVLKKTGTAKTAKFLDDIKDLVSRWLSGEVFPSTLMMLSFRRKRKTDERRL